MRFYFVHNDPEHTTLVSANGVAHYKVRTVKAHSFATPMLQIWRPSSRGRDGKMPVAEVEWRRFGSHPIIRSHMFDGILQELEVRQFLYKLGRHFTQTRYFLGDDDREYRWKVFKDVGLLLMDPGTDEVLARFVQENVKEGIFQGEKKWCLEVKPTTLNTDMVVVTFLIMEKRRRDRVTVDAMKTRYHDEDPAEGGCEGDGTSGGFA